MPFVHASYGFGAGELGANMSLTLREFMDLPRANEIVCFKLDGSMNTLVVAINPLLDRKSSM